MQKMLPRERVLTALNCKEPDRVPWVEKYVHWQIASKILGHSITPIPGARIPPEVLKVLPLDNISYNFRPPSFIKKQWTISDVSTGEGLLRSWDDLEYFRKQLPDPDDDRLYKPVREFLARYKKDYAALVDTRAGIANAYISMGMEHFSLMLYDDLMLVEAVLDMFSDWSAKVMKNISEVGFDIVVVSDDFAGKSGPLFSPQIIRDIFLPRYQKVVANIKLPWILHSDGNILPILDDLLLLGMKGIANIEPGPMDILQLKKDYKDKVCLMGNIDLHYTLTQGSAQETADEVRQRIQQIAPGGGYILATSNGVTAYCKPENVKAMAQNLLKYGNYPIV